MKKIYAMIIAAANSSSWAFPSTLRKLIFYSIFMAVSLFALAPALALDPGLPPGKNFDLSHWYLGLPYDGADADIYSDSISVASLTNGYTSEWFYTGADGSMVFWSPVTGATTEGTTYPRSELRETIVPDNTAVNWSSYGISILAAQCKVLQVPSTGKIIIGQIHSKTGLARPLVKLYYDNGLVKALVKYSADDTNDNSDITYEFVSGVALNTAINYNIKDQDGLLTMTVNGVTETHNIFTQSTGWEDEEHYFKAGDYCQDNVGDSSEGGRVAFYSLALYHSASITNQPASITNSSGSNVTFTVGASSNGTLSYQWFKGTNSLAGKTSTTLALNGISAADAGDYTVVVLDNTSSYSAITSAVASLTVLPSDTSILNFTNAGITNWICPTNVSSVRVECWGGGGAGGSAKRISTTSYGGGGAGGAYARYNSYPVTPGNTYYISVGAGGANSSTNENTTVPGGDSWFNTNNSPSPTIIAKGGAGGETAVGTSTANAYGLLGAGTTSGSAGNVVYAGGSGATATSSGGGGGGSSAGSASDGTDATSRVGAIAPAGGGDGGAGRASTSGVGTNGYAPGGGGGGARSSSSSTPYAGGTGAEGLVILTYAPDNVAPSVSLTAPTNGTVFTSTTIAMTADASDANGTITTVSFYNGATLLGSDTSAPYAYTWGSVPAGSYDLTARATDSDGTVSTSEVATVRVNATPSVSLTAPTNGATFTAPASIALTADASDTDGTIATVGFYNGATLLGSDTSAPYAYTWTNVAGGSYNLTARATDNDGGARVSSAASVTVNSTYTLTVNSGTGDGLYLSGEQVVISADAPAPAKVFSQWTGDTQYVNNVTYTNATVTMPANAVTLTATYTDIYYDLTITGGSGSGSYTNGEQVAITADAPAPGMTFDKWIGDTQVVASVSSASTTVTMPIQAADLTATYKNLPGYYTLTVNNGTGGGVYSNGVQVAVAAVAPEGTAFDRWTGDTQIVAGIFSLNTIVTMSAQDASLTAVCEDASAGAVNINWMLSAGTYFDPDITSILGPTGSGKTTIAQLMYSPDAVKDSILSNGAGAENDVVLDTFTITESGDGITEYGVFSASTVRVWTNGYVYALIFQDGNVQPGDWYLSGPVAALEKISGGDPQNIDINTDALNGDAINGAQGRQVERIALTVNSGSGSGSYTNGQQVAISADTPAEGQLFDQWTGDTAYVNNVTYTNALVTMPAQAVALTATYKSAAVYHTLTGSAGANGTVSPTSTNMLAGNSATFVITADNYYRIATLTTNGTAVMGMTFDNSSASTNYILANVQTNIDVMATFTNQVTTNAPADVPYEWLAGYGLTNSGATFDQAADADTDLDGLTAWQEYITGTDPTNTASCFNAAQTTLNKVSWSAVSGRVYSVYWSTNLMNGFTALNTNIPYPQNSYTNATPDPRVNHYQIKVRLQ